jgi:hypothetical protein
MDDMEIIVLTVDGVCASVAARLSRRSRSKAGTSSRGGRRSKTVA